MTLQRQVVFRVKCESPSAWSVSFTKERKEIEIGLHFGDKILPTHVAVLSHADFENMVRELMGSTVP